MGSGIGESGPAAEPAGRLFDARRGFSIWFAGRVRGPEQRSHAAQGQLSFLQNRRRLIKVHAVGYSGDIQSREGKGLPYMGPPRLPDKRRPAGVRHHEDASVEGCTATLLAKKDGEIPIGQTRAHDDGVLRTRGPKPGLLFTEDEPQRSGRTIVEKLRREDRQSPV